MRLLAFTLMIGCTVAANLFMKIGASVPSPQRLIAGLLDWRVVVGLVFFGCAGIIYAWLLRWVPLNLAQSFAAAQYVAVIIVSAYLLSEEISRARWIGIALIAAGIVLIGATAARPRQPPTERSLPHEPMLSGERGFDQQPVGHVANGRTDLARTARHQHFHALTSMS
jgi:undecaprenyl phosphate-alpha-L-ara4N flippase subunit ArnE